MEGDSFVIEEGEVKDLPGAAPSEPEVIEEKPADGEAKDPEPPVNDGEPGDPEEEGEEPEKEPEKPKETRAQRRIRELIESNKEKDKLLEHYKTLSDGKKEPGKAEPIKEKAEPQPPDASKYTSQEAYDADYKKYVGEYQKWYRDSLKDELRAEMKAEAEKERAESEASKAQTETKAKLEKAAEKFKDFDTVAGKDSELGEVMRSNPYMADAAWGSENYAEVAYYLGQHLDEAEKIAALPPLQAVKEIGKLEARLGKAPEKPAKEPSKAPEPVKTLKGAGDASVDDSKLSTKEWIERENKRELERKRR